MLEKLQNLVREHTGNNDLTIHSDTVLLTGLGLNSYELVELICRIEDEFDVEIPDRYISSFKTVQNVLDYITEHE